MKVPECNLCDNTQNLINSFAGYQGLKTFLRAKGFEKQLELRFFYQIRQVGTLRGAQLTLLVFGGHVFSNLARGSFKASIPKLYIKTLDLSEVMAKQKKTEEFKNPELTPEGFLEPFKNYLEQPGIGQRHWKKTRSG